uniref:Uncharacterized protein n=1 Tax=Oryza glumipatula TaxID=40148 RepID=A0A0D9ZTC5_9ORYZ
MQKCNGEIARLCGWWTLDRSPPFFLRISPQYASLLSRLYIPPPPRSSVHQQPKQEAILELNQQQHLSPSCLVKSFALPRRRRCLAAAATAAAAAAASAAAAAADARCSLMWRPQPPPGPSSSLLHPTRRALEEWRWRWRAARTAAAAATPASVAPAAAAAPAAPATESIVVVARLHEDLSYGCCYCRSEL